MRILSSLILLSLIGGGTAANATVPGEVAKRLASCDVAALGLEAADLHVELLDEQGDRLVRIYARNGPSGSGAYLTERYWLVDPRTCRMLALQVGCAGGQPECSGWVMHRAGEPPSPAEITKLLALLPGGRANSSRPEQQAAAAPSVGWYPSPYVSAPDDDADAEISAAPILRATKLPARPWVRGAPMKQSYSWTESTFETNETEQPDDVLDGFVATGPIYSVFRGDCCVRPKRTMSAGAARLHVFASPSRAIHVVSWLVLEQPARKRSSWIASSTDFRLLGVARGRAWLTIPVRLDPGFSLLALDLETGESAHVVLERSAGFDPEEHWPVETTTAGIVLELRDEEGRAEKRILPWSLLEAAVREASERSE